MSKLNIDQSTILELFSDKKSDFLIPDYQRPYAWTEDECATLWDDLFSFAFPGNASDQFDSDNDEYFLGPIVTFKNNDGKLEIIDGQQRLTTIMLLLRAFYSKFEMAQDQNTIDTRKLISQCIWKTDEFGNPKMGCLKIDSEVASDDDKDEFLEILRTGNVTAEMDSRYAQTYRYFVKNIAEFTDSYPMYTALLPIRLMKNVILLPIEAESQDTALRIFSTLNDRGLPLSDADIFKSQFYKHYSSIGKKDEFIERWKRLEEQTKRIFKPLRGTPMDELFTRYMYYERALQGNRNTTTEALRDFYEKNRYELLTRDGTLENLEALAAFWERVETQDDSFGDDVTRMLFILDYAPNGMWTYLTSVYFMANRRDDGSLEETAFRDFLSRIIGFIWAYAIERPGVNALRSPVYPEMINIVNGQNATFDAYKFKRDDIRSRFENYVFANGRPITKSMLAWWALQNDTQQTPELTEIFEIEHIFAKKRADIEGALRTPKNMESLGNKALLEKRINVRASDYRFADKKKYYLGYTDKKGTEKKRTENSELVQLATTLQDFTEDDIEARNAEILDGFMQYLAENELLAD